MCHTLHRRISNLYHECHVSLTFHMFHNTLILISFRNLDLLIFLYRCHRQFREAVFARDKHKCAVCGVSGELDAHHITDRNDMPNGGYVVENGISLCPSCHDLAEDFHRGASTKEGYYPDELYARIGSNKQIAESASSRLSRTT